jgi:hypothetical protein
VHRNRIHPITLAMILGLTLLLVTTSVVWGGEKAGERSIVNILALFVSSGYMGDGEYGTKYISLDGAWDSLPHSEPTCIRIAYTFGPVGWAGIYWQNEPDNWGDEKGENYSRKKFSKVTFWSKGEIGGEILEFKTGGIHNPNKKFHDSFSGKTGRVSLSQEWKKFEIDLKGADLSSVIGGFCWVAAENHNHGEKVTFYIDDVAFE